jgi:hypothetical protein
MDRQDALEILTLQIEQTLDDLDPSGEEREALLQLWIDAIFTVRNRQENV